MTGVHKTTITRLLVETGEQCAILMNERLRNLPCTEIEADEIWTFVGKKQRRLTPDERSNPELGDQYTFVGFDPTSKLIAAYAVGKRNAWTTTEFLLQLRARIPGRIQLSTDGFAQYPAAVGGIYGSNIDYAQIDKRYAAAAFDESRYSPADRHRYRHPQRDRAARAEPRLHVLRRAQQLDDPYAGPPLYAIDAWVLAQAEEPESGCRALLRPLQLLPDSRLTPA